MPETYGQCRTWEKSWPEPESKETDEETAARAKPCRLQGLCGLRAREARERPQWGERCLTVHAEVTEERPQKKSWGRCGQRKSDLFFGAKVGL